MELKLQRRTKRKRRSHHLTSRTVQALQDIFHLFERSKDVFLEGRELAASMVEHGIHLTDTEVNSTLSILNNHGNMMDIHEFCHLVITAVDHLLAIRDDIKSERPLLVAIKEFLLLSAIANVQCRDVDTRKSPQPLPFYFAGVRTSGLTEKQLAVRACSLDTSRNSPYKQPVVLPGLPPGNGANIVAPVSPCTIIPPRPSKVGGRRLSRCTILPYEGGTGSLANERRRSTMMYQSIAMSSKPADETRKVQLQGHGAGEGTEPRPRGRPLSFRLPDFPDYHGKMLTFDDLVKIEDEMVLAQRNHRLKNMRHYAARKIINSIPSKQFRKQFKHTIKAYLG